MFGVWAIVSQNWALKFAEWLVREWVMDSVIFGMWATFFEIQLNLQIDQGFYKQNEQLVFSVARVLVI